MLCTPNVLLQFWAHRPHLFLVTVSVRAVQTPSQFLTDFANVLLEKLAGYEIGLEVIVSLTPSL